MRGSRVELVSWRNPLKRATLVLALAALSIVPGTVRADEAAPDPRITELERKVEVLTQELANMATAPAATRDTTALRSRLGFAPAAAKVYGAQGISIGGYGEALYEAFDGEREDGRPSGAVNRVDFLRQVIYVGYAFDERLHFNSEIELEHAGVRDEAEVAVDPATGEGKAELSGEVSLEFAYVDWRFRQDFGIRAGLVLVPLGMTNEMHEPPVFLGARRPSVERVIIPTTWSGIGAGVFGESASGWSYRAYVLEGLDSRGFSADQTIRGGRHNGSQSPAMHPAFAARIDFAGIAGLSIGGSAYTGEAQQDAKQALFRVSLGDVHARWQWRGIEARGLWALGSLGNASVLSEYDYLRLTSPDQLGERFGGGYVEAGYDLATLFAPGTRCRAIPYVRFEAYDTQDDVSAGSGDQVVALENPANEVRVATFGAALAPHPQIVLKIDREQRSNKANTELSQWNVALGYLF